jgi:hypothetical protein
VIIPGVGVAILNPLSREKLFALERAKKNERASEGYEPAQGVEKPVSRGPIPATRRDHVQDWLTNCSPYV